MANKPEKEKKEKTKRKPMSAETKAKIRKARRNRVKQPREGQSKKSKGMYAQLKTEYGSLIKTNAEVAKWFSDNKEALKNDDSMQFGVLNDYEEMYISWREFKLSKIYFGKNAMNIDENILAEDKYDFMDEDDEKDEDDLEEEELFSYTLDDED